MSNFSDAPRRPTTSGAPSGFAIFCMRVWDTIWGARFPFVDTDTIKIDRSRKGYAFNVVKQPASASGAQANMMPFKIYNISNTTDSTLSWRTFQIRCGYIGWRTKSEDLVFQGNFEQLIFCPFDGAGDVFDSPPIPSIGPSILLSNNQDTLILDKLANEQTGNPILPQIVLQPQFDDFHQIAASFWIKVLDDDEFGLNIQLWGRMYSDNVFDSTGRPSTIFPAPDPTMIPLGHVFYLNDQQQSFVGQFQWGNLLNRFAPTAPPVAPRASPMQYRGAWTADNLSGQTFYPGDLVVDDTQRFNLAFNPVDGSVQAYYYVVYMFIDDARQISQPPIQSPGQWRDMFSQIHGGT